MFGSLKAAARLAIAFALPAAIRHRASALSGTAFLGKAALRSFFGIGKPFVMINVGACDGVLFDDATPWLKRIRGSRAVLVEPIPYNYRRLRENYPDTDRHIIEPLVIAREAGPINIKTFDEKALEAGDLPMEFVGCSSLKDTNLVSGVYAFGQTDPNFDQFVSHLKNIETHAERLETVLERNHIERIDAFLVDCEGSDWDVFEQLDLERWRPGMIKIEIGSMVAEDVGNTLLKLKRADYHVGIHGEDIWAFAS